ncbi:exosortase H-associated membrane protein [Brevundimonas sp.]|uniref:exosortase H-associated membrane protein n=1 Tax=Brevundimonas sp. TaxID=1871086 RepID=UPI0025C28118|nr:exosortase H-associated membrane protein [Brevundimonas sp.]
MSGWRDMLRARTNEEAARRRFGLWALCALVVLLPLWWWVGADLAAAVLRPITGLFVRLFGLTGEIRTASDGGWLMGTRLPTASGEPYFQPLSHEMIRRMLLTAPLLAAFLIAPPRTVRPWRALGVGVLVTAGLFLVSATAVTWGEIAPMLNPALAPEPGAAASLVGQPLNPVAAQVALLGRYLGLSVGPLAAAITTWAVLNPAGREALLGGLDETPAGGAPDAGA